MSRRRKNGGGGADGVVDLRLTRNGETYLVQCKQWRAFKVGVNVVRELYGVMAAAGGFVVTSGQLEEAAKFATKIDLAQVNGEKLQTLIHKKWQRSPSEYKNQTTPAILN